MHDEWIEYALVRHPLDYGISLPAKSSPVEHHNERLDSTRLSEITSFTDHRIASNHSHREAVPIRAITSLIDPDIPFVLAFPSTTYNRARSSPISLEPRVFTDKSTYFRYPSYRAIKHYIV